MKIIKDKITDRTPMTIKIDNDKGLFDSPHLVRANKIELIGNEIFFYFGKELVFKVWLLKEEYKDLNEALKEAKIRIV